MVQLKNICLRAFFSLLFPFLTSKQVCLLQLYLQHEDEPFNSLRCSLAISTSSFTPNNILSLWNFLSFPLSCSLLLSLGVQCYKTLFGCCRSRKELEMPLQLNSKLQIVSRPKNKAIKIVYIFVYRLVQRIEDLNGIGPLQQLQSQYYLPSSLFVFDSPYLLTLKCVSGWILFLFLTRKMCPQRNTFLDFFLPNLCHNSRVKA